VLLPDLLVTFANVASQAVTTAVAVALAAMKADPGELEDHMARLRAFIDAPSICCVWPYIVRSDAKRGPVLIGIRELVLLFCDIGVAVDLEDAVRQLRLGRPLRGTVRRLARVSATEGDLEAGAICLVCRDKMDVGGTVRLDCGHCFHEDCIEAWERRTAICPRCGRQEFTGA
jgi:hypothetical protein